MAHAVRANCVQTSNQEKALVELQSQNLQLKNKVRFLKLAWRKKTLTNGKLHGALLIEVGTSGEANTLVQECLLHNHELKNCEIFHSECNTTQCFKCYQ
jgi:hypothetical protein